ncbi:hypothetical protein QET40_10920 [Akkermansia sp. N21169]|nr:hypothetical protein [Akkermansia sp. N21169]
MEGRMISLLKYWIGILCVLFGTLGELSYASGEQTGTSDAVRKEWFYVGQYRTKIAPERARVFMMPAQGVVTDLVASDKRIAKGTIIARVNKEDLELDRKTMEMEILKERVARKDEIQKLRKEREEIEFISSLPRKERQFYDQSGKNVNSSKEVLKTIDEKIELAQRQIELLDSQKRAEFAKKEESYVVKMPYDGRLQYQFQKNDSSDQEGAFLETGKEIAAVCDDSAFYLTVVISNPEIANIPSDKLKLSLEVNNSCVIDGHFSHKRVEKNQSGGGNMDMLVFYFKVDPKDHDILYSMLGANCVAKLYFKVDDDIRVFGKMDLARLPLASAAIDWQEIIKQVAPDYELILIGETQLFARKK